MHAFTRTPRPQNLIRATHASALLSAVLLACAAPTTARVGSSTARGVSATPRETAIPADISMPNAIHALPVDTERMPTVAVAGDKIFCNGALVGSTQPIVSARRIMRVDALMEALKRTREGWIADHPGRAFDGSALFIFDHTASALVVKSVFQTAAFAGYPNAQFAVRMNGGAMARLNVDAMLPGTADAPARENADELHLVVGSSKYRLVWRRRGVVTSTVDVPVGGNLAESIRAVWTANSIHQGRSDKILDDAILLLGDDVDYAGIIKAADAIYATTRVLDVGGLIGPTSAFNVYLGMAKDVGTAVAFARGGRLPPQLIQQTVRQNMDRYRNCYEQGLARGKTLEGSVRIRFVIQSDGSVGDVNEAGQSTLTDVTTVKCIMHEFQQLTFPKPEGGPVTVVYPLIFNPAE